MSLAVTRADINRVYPVIAPHIRRTPIVTINAAEFGMAPFPLTLKLEQLQHAGSFKTRGAFANLLTRNPPKTGVVAASGGNHGAAVAYAAMKLGSAGAHLRADGLVSRQDRSHSPVRREPHRRRRAVRGSAGREHRVRQDVRRDAGARVRSGGDDDAGQGTLALELAQQQAPELDTVLVAVGGGGLIGGIAAWYESETRVDRRRA